MTRLAAAAAALAIVLVLAGGVTTGHRGAPAPPVEREVSDATMRPGSVTVAASATPGRPVPPGFLGFSFEFQAVRAYTGSDPGHVNPVLVNLMRALSPGQPPVLRIGGDSSDISYAPAAGLRVPRFVTYRLTPSWLATTAALQRATGARLILGLNLAADEPQLDRVEARAYARAFAPGSVAALEIGNEPNVYTKITVLHTLLGVPVPARPAPFGYPEFRRQFLAVARRVAALRGGADGPPLAGPALALGPTPDSGSWVRQMPGFLSAQRRLRTMTVHRYPLRNCDVPPRSPQYPTIAHLLSPYATAGLAASLRRWIAIAHGRGRALRVDELNSVACRGKAGVSDTFASALWVTDALFALVNAGVDGVNVHTLPDSAYELFSFSETNGRWSALVRPVYYGLKLFAEAAPAGSRLIALHVTGRHPGVSLWATRAPDGRTRIIIINKGLRRGERLRIETPAGAGPEATVEWLRAGSVAAQGGVTLGGVSFGPRTATGVLPAPHLETVAVRQGQVSVSVPAASAALVTLG